MAQLGRPENARERRLRNSANEIRMIVKIAVKNKGIACGKRTGIPHLGKRGRTVKCVKDRLHIQRAEQRMILFPVKY